MIAGARIIESLMMVEPGPPVTVRRSWRERLFTRPWRPLVTTKVIRPLVPLQYALHLPSGDYVMHPEMAQGLRMALQKQEKLCPSAYTTLAFP